MSNKTLGRRIGKLRGEVRRREVEGVIARWRDWDGTQAAFCESVGISTQSLIRWRKSVGDAPLERTFVEVSTPALPAATYYEIIFPSGVSVRAPIGFDEREVSRLLALAHAAC